jgi:hypothetical protein
VNGASRSASSLGFAGKKIIYLSPIVEQVEPVGDGAADGALKSLAS